jgi:glutamine amidotransferase
MEPAVAGAHGLRAVIAVVDYGAGNIGSLLAALERRRAEFTATGDPEAVERADAVVLPGDGAFGATMHALRALGLDLSVRRAIERGVPFLGICVGMQLLFERSTEFDAGEGLGVFSGAVERFSRAPRVPHMGWNSLELVAQHRLLAGLQPREFVYFLHSYRVAVVPETLACATYGESFSAIVARENVMGTQFHPEKSQRAGGILLDNFIALAKELR